MTTPEQKPKVGQEYQHGQGLGSLRTTKVFRAINFELYAKPNAIIMALGGICFLGTLGYITYMRSKYESLGYYAAVQQDGTEVFTKKKSRWE